MYLKVKATGNVTEYGENVYSVHRKGFLFFHILTYFYIYAPTMEMACHKARVEYNNRLLKKAANRLAGKDAKERIIEV